MVYCVLKTEDGTDRYTGDETLASSERYDLWFVMLLSPRLLSTASS